MAPSKSTATRSKGLVTIAKQAKVWTGSAWADLASATTDLTPYSTTAQMNTAIDDAKGLTLVNATTFTTSSAVIIDNVFTSTYQNYKMIINYSAASGTDAVITVVGRASGSDVTTAGTWFSQQESTVGSSYSTAAVSAGRVSIVNTGFAERVQQVLEIQSPQLAKITSYQTQYLSYNSGGQTYSYKHIGIYNATTQMDGFKLLPSTGTISGTIRIYGYKN